MADMAPYVTGKRINTTEYEQQTCCASRVTKKMTRDTIADGHILWGGVEDPHGER